MVTTVEGYVVVAPHGLWGAQQTFATTAAEAWERHMGLRQRGCYDPGEHAIMRHRWMKRGYRLRHATLIIADGVSDEC